MRKYIVEFIGTFFLILAISIVVIKGETGIPALLAIGTVLIAMIYAGGHISKAHYNPAVTLAFYIEGGVKTNLILGYIIAQLAAAFIAPPVAMLIFADSGELVEPTLIVHNTIPSLLAEFLGTFSLVFVIMNVARGKGTKGNSFYGLAIGCSVIGCAYLFGSVSGGVFNPAVAISVVLLGVVKMADIWIYMLANFLGAAVAAYTFVFTNEK
jgi:aquaporin Z